VAVGVSHERARINVDRITDHYVLVFGRRQGQSGVSYPYNDPATRQERFSRAGSFFVDSTTGNLVHEGSVARGRVYMRHTEMSMVVRSVE
jgi:hypothetical protein